MIVLIKAVDQDSAPTSCWCLDQGSGAEVVVPLAGISNYTAAGKTVPTLKRDLIGHHLSGTAGGSWQLIA